MQLPLKNHSAADRIIAAYECTDEMNTGLNATFF